MTDKERVLHNMNETLATMVAIRDQKTRLPSTIDMSSLELDFAIESIKAAIRFIKSIELWGDRG